MQTEIGLTDVPAEASPWVCVSAKLQVINGSRNEGLVIEARPKL